MAKRIHIIKRKGHKEQYESKKVYASIYAAALNCEYGESKSEKIASTVTKKVNLWIKSKKQVTSAQIRVQVINQLQKLDADVYVLYKHHLDLS